MICVTIGRTRHKMVIAEHQALADRGAELVELRLDWIKRNPDLGRLLKDCPTPVVVTCRKPEDGGRFSGDEEARITLLRQAIVSGADYVDLEMEIAGDIPRYGSTKRIVSHHNFQETPDNIEEIHEQMCKLDPDIVKLVTTANSPLDNVRMLELVKNSKVPTIGFCMGEYGVVSRLLCGKFGSPMTYATFSKDRVLAPGQLSFDDMKSLYRYDSISEKTAIFGVLGDPIGHSWSPLLHNTAFKSMRMNAVYLPMRVPPEEFAKTLKAYESLGIRGYSVTIPHKAAALKFAKRTDSSTKAIGSANTLFLDRQGRWCATNTDYQAALDSILLGLKEKGTPSLSGNRVLILGSGGVARAIGKAMIKHDAIVTVTNRTKGNGEKLATELGCQFVSWSNRGSVGTDVLVNCTPVGMHPNFNETPYKQHWFRDGLVVFDTIYNPENTLFIKEAREHLCHVVSGIEMFVRQAAAQFKWFTGREIPLTSMMETLRHGMSPLRNKISEQDGESENEFDDEAGIEPGELPEE